MRMEREKGVALITSLMVLLLISAIVVGMCWMVMTDQRLGGNNQSRELAFYGAEAGMEKMTTDVANVFATSGSLTAANVTTITAAPPNLIPGVKYLNPPASFNLSVYPRRIRNPATTPRFCHPVPYAGMQGLITPFTTDGGSAEHGNRVRSEVDQASPGRVHSRLSIWHLFGFRSFVLQRPLVWFRRPHAHQWKSVADSEPRSHFSWVTRLP